MKFFAQHMFWYSPMQFALVRFLLGLWVCYTFVRLIPYAGELFTSAGIAPKENANYLYGYIPDILYFIDATWFVVSLLGVLSIVSILFAVGWYRAYAAVVLWATWATLFIHNPFTEDPSVAFIGWLLLAYALIPAGEAYSIAPEKNHEWKMSRVIYWGAWIVLGTAFTVSGIDRFFAPSWWDGTAMYYFYQLQITRDWWLVALLQSQPMWLIQLQTWGSAWIFTLTLPAVMFRGTRFLWWILLSSMFVFVLLVTSLTDVVIGMFLFYLFVFDSRWWVPTSKARYTIRFDSSCGMCRALVSYVQREDWCGQFIFEPLPTSENKNVCLDSIELQDEKGNVLYHDEAVLGITTRLGGLHIVTYLGYLISHALRLRMYNWVGCNRHRISNFFGLKGGE